VLLTTWEARIEPSGVDRTNACAGDRGFKVHSDPKFEISGARLRVAIRK